jgi:hypothetical protein
MNDVYAATGAALQGSRWTGQTLPHIVPREGGAQHFEVGSETLGFSSPRSD